MAVLAAICAFAEPAIAQDSTLGGMLVKALSNSLAKVVKPTPDTLPNYAKPLDILTLPDADGSGASDLLEAAAARLYPNRADISAGITIAIKEKVAMLTLVSNGLALTKGDMARYLAAENCATLLVADQKKMLLDEVEWESELIEATLPTDKLMKNEKLLQVKRGYDELTLQYGQHYEAIKKGLKPLPKAVAQACPAGVLRAKNKDQQPEPDIKDNAFVVVTGPIRTAGGEPTDAGVLQGLRVLMDKTQRGVTTQVLSAKNLGCKKDISAYVCDIDSRTRMTIVTDFNLGTKPTTTIRESRMMDRFRFNWLGDTWGAVPNNG